MQVDFYQLTRDPAESIAATLAAKTLAAGERLLILTADAAQQGRIGEKLWEHAPESFLANGRQTGEHPERQPILIGGEEHAANGARFAMIADGAWREGALAFQRLFYLFPPDRVEEARAAWRGLAGRDDVVRNFWKQEGAKWVKQA